MMKENEQTLKDINSEFEKFLSHLGRDYNKKEIKNAYDFAKKAHVFQKRYTGEPYISHPLEVAKTVHEIGMDDISIISALLHDVVEDTEVTLKEIKEHFGEDVEKIVDGLTKITDFGRKKEDLKIEALRKILLASAKDIRILIIKLCDRLHNMRTLEELPDDKKIKTSKETMLIYVPIAQKIGLYAIKWELEDLAFKYRNPEMYQFIKKKVAMKRKEREEIVNKAVHEIKSILRKNQLRNTKVLGRPKNFFSIYKKIKDDAKSFDEILDLYAVRIITQDVAGCYNALGILHENFKVYPNKLKDYISNPKSNGYESIHTVIYSREINFPVEVQIRTDEMHKLAEFGIAAHWRYKNLQEDKKFEKKMSWLREVLEWEKEHKDNEEFMKLLKFDFFENEIFVFTPKSDVFVLPENSTVLDMAYAVHTDLGHKATKAKVNGVITTIDKTLKSGDIVEIITNRNSKPTEKWLKIVKTNKARIKIRQQLNLKHSGKQNPKIDEISFEKLKSKISRLNEFKKVRKAKCCTIRYKDQIVGVLGKGKELVVHNASCENAKYTINEKIQLRWMEEKEKQISLILTLKDKIGLLIDILNTFSKSNINILGVNSKTMKNGDTKMTIALLDGPYIDKLVTDLNKYDFVEHVKIQRGLFW